MHVLTYLLLISCLFRHIINAYFCILLHIFAFCCIHIAYSCICLHICTYSRIDNAAFNVQCFCNPTFWTTRTLPRSLHTTTGSHPPPQALSHRSHHQSLQPLPSCCRGWCQCHGPPLEPMAAWTRWT